VVTETHLSRTFIIIPL
jgi:hypothetical protein